MNSFFAAGLLENPWILLVIVVGSALANWLAKRREQKAASQQEQDEPPMASEKPPGEISLEEAMRRLLGGELPTQVPAPPRIPRTQRGELPPAPPRLEEDEDLYEPVEETVPRSTPPPIVIARSGMPPTAASEQRAQAALRFEQLSEQGRHPAIAVGHARGYPSSGGKGAVSLWRDPRSARQAFVASLVFGPPKGLEP